MKEIYQLSKFKRGDFFVLSNKIVLNQTIRRKDFSECFIQQVNFSNCILDWTSFPYSNCEDLTFEHCILQNVNFKKSELDHCIFKNCQLINITFAGSDLMDFDFINCKLNFVYFNAGELSDLKFENSQLESVSFSGSLLDNVKIKNSTLEKIEFNDARIYKETYENGVLVVNRIPIKDYNSFLKEINKLEDQHPKDLGYIQKYLKVSSDNLVLFETMFFFILVSFMTYCLLN